MTFDPNIPKNLPPPTVSVDQIRTDFSQYGNIFGNNHVALNDTNQGKHTNVLLQQHLPDPVVSGGFDSLYCKPVISNAGISEQVFVKIPQFLPSQFPNNPMQLTFNYVNTAGPQYQSFLAGGYTVFWGKILSTTNTPINTQITLFPAPTKILCVIPNPTRIVGVTGLVSAPLQISVTVNNNSQFTINAQALFVPFITGDINWLAIAQQ